MKNSMIKNLAALTATAVLAFTSIAYASDPQVATLRGAAPLNEEATPPIIDKVENNDLKRQRDYPQQPPTIPHDISKYQLDKNFNKCMDCHSRKFADEAQAPAVSVTHYMNREGDFLGEVSPRRYFCTQCHVHQLESKPLVENEFVDMEELIRKSHKQAK